LFKIFINLYGLKGLKDQLIFIKEKLSEKDVEYLTTIITKECFSCW